MQDSWVRKIPWRRKWQPTPVILPGEFHRQRSLAGDSPWGCKESDMTEQLSLTLAFWIIISSEQCLIISKVCVPSFPKCLASQSWPALCDPLNCSLPSSSVHGISQTRILEWVVILLLQRIFQTQGSNLRLLCLLHWGQILYPLSHGESPFPSALVY